MPFGHTGAACATQLLDAGATAEVAARQIERQWGLLGGLL